MDLVLGLVCLWTNPYCPIRIVPGEGKKGISGRGGILTLIGILIPLVFLAIYLWF